MADYRTARDRRLAPPPALPRPDAIERTARQVRLDDWTGATVHALAGKPRTTGMGREYPVRCDQTLTAFEGAILTTAEVTCPGCVTGRSTSLRGHAGGGGRG